MCGVSFAMCWVFDFRQATEPSLSLRYPLERRSAAPTFLGLLRGLGEMMHAKHGAYFLIRLKCAVCIFGH